MKTVRQLYVIAEVTYRTENTCALIIFPKIFQLKDFSKGLEPHVSSGWYLNIFNVVRINGRCCIAMQLLKICCIVSIVIFIYIAFIDTFSNQKRYIHHISTHYVFLKLHLQKYDIQVLIILYIIYSLTFIHHLYSQQFYAVHIHKQKWNYKRGKKYKKITEDKNKLI